MKKSVTRDIQLLAIIRKYQKKMEGALKLFSCDTQKQLVKHEYALDLCAMYIAQIGEASKNLTDESKQKLTSVKPEMMHYFRNMVAHVYESVKKEVLAAYVFQVVSDKAVLEVIEQIRNCQEKINMEKSMKRKTESRNKSR